MKLKDYLKINPLDKYKNIYLIGVSGIGMSAIAKILLQLNYNVAGSDTVKSDEIDPLIHKGLIFFQTQNNSNNLKQFNPQIVIYSAAIKKDHIEFDFALNYLNCFVIPRNKFLNILLKGYIQIAILGTHGKTSTTSFLSQIFLEAKKDPLVFLGGILASLGYSNSYFGKGDYAIFEACEAYEGLKAYSNIDWAFINNIDLDHIDYFLNLKNLRKEFYQFIKNNFLYQFQKILFLNYDDPNIKYLLKYIKFKHPHYLDNLNIKIISIKERPISINVLFNYSTFNVTNIKYNSLYTEFDVNLNSKFLTHLKTPLYGIHNIYNILGAFVIAFFAQIPIQTIQKSILNFKNAKRRFELLYKTSLKTSFSLSIYTDYAHHPKEIFFLYKMLKQLDTTGYYVFVFQPHLDSRTMFFFKSFTMALKNIPKVIITKTFFARKSKNIAKSLIPKQKNANSAFNLFENIKKVFPNKNVQYSEDYLSIYNNLMQDFNLSKNIYIVFLGAGDIDIVAQKFILFIKNNLTLE